jgi:cytochrome c oxidase subunit II
MKRRAGDGWRLVRAWRSLCAGTGADAVDPAATVGVEKRIIAAAGVFVLALSGIIALTVRLFEIGLPTCLTDVRPFREAAVIEQAPKRYEIHYVAKMWKFEPEDLAVLPGSVVDIYLSTADVTHGLQIIGTNVNIMAVPGAVNFASATRVTSPCDARPFVEVRPVRS